MPTTARRRGCFGLEGMSLSSDGPMLYVADGNRGEAKYAFNRVRMIDLPH